ncbi:MAG: hypothetical protein IJ202_05215 [Bacteroidales bacterium]|nr:hypothetical protein [Bacteroidales bacterium]
MKENKFNYWFSRNFPGLLDFLVKVKNGKKMIPKCDWPEERLIASDMKEYEEGIGHTFDYNHPVLFTEKLIWYKRNFKGDGHLDRIVDKINFKSYIEEKLGPGHTIPLIKTWSTLKDFKKDWDSLPEEFCLKSSINHSGIGVYIVHKKSEVDFKDVCYHVRLWLNPFYTSLNSYGSAYYTTTPRVLAEEYKANVANQLFDYKIFCFDGKPYCVYAAIDHFGDDGSHISFYDMDWNWLDVSYGNHKVRKLTLPSILRR